MVAVFNSAPVTPYELVPLLLRPLGRGEAADVVADGFGLFAVAQALEPDGDDAAGIRKAALDCACRKDGDGALFDAPVLFDGFAVAGPCCIESVPDVFEKAALIGFDLLEVFTSFFDCDAGGSVLVVQGVGGDGFSGERNLCADQVLGRFELAVFSVAFFLEQ